MSGGLTPCRQLRPSSRREHVKASKSHMEWKNKQKEKQTTHKSLKRESQIEAKSSLIKVCTAQPFKTAYNKAVDGWMRSHPGKTITIYEVPSLRCLLLCHVTFCLPSKILGSIPLIGICSPMMILRLLCLLIVN